MTTPVKSNCHPLLALRATGSHGCRTAFLRSLPRSDLQSLDLWAGGVDGGMGVRARVDTDESILITLREVSSAAIVIRSWYCTNRFNMPFNTRSSRTSKPPICSNTDDFVSRSIVSSCRAARRKKVRSMRPSIRSLVLGGLSRTGIPLGCDDRAVSQSVLCREWIYPVLAQTGHETAAQVTKPTLSPQRSPRHGGLVAGHDVCYRLPRPSGEVRTRC